MYFVGRSFKFILILIPLFASASSFAWWDTGHEITAQIALKNLTPQSLAQVNRLLAFPLASPGSKELSLLTKESVLASTWADIVKVSPLYAESFKKDPYGADCHFLGANFSRAEVSDFMAQGRVKKESESSIRERLRKEKSRTSKNILSCIEKTLQVLEKKKTGNENLDESQALALRYLIHLVGDLHQPLHNFSVDEDQGGIKTKVSPLEIHFYSPPSHEKKPPAYVNNLHFSWDAMFGITEQLPMIKFFRESEVKPQAFEGHLAFSQKIAEDFLKEQDSPTLRAQLSHAPKRDFETWSLDAIKIGFEKSYGPLQTPQQTHAQSIKNDLKLKHIVQSQLVLAGLRLAQLLNEVFKDTVKE